MRFRITTLDGGQGVAIHEMDALDEADAHRQALARGLRVLAIQAARLKGWRRARLSLVAFSSELVALLEAGLSLVEAIDALTEKERDESVRHLLEGLRRRLYEGQSLSVALGEFPSSFPTLYVATVRASERTGAIAEALRRFVAYQQQIDLLKKRLINASIHPAVLLAAGSLVVLFLVAYVVPRFSGIYEDIGGGLPVVTAFEMTRGLLAAAARPQLAAATRAVSEGRSLTDALAAQGLTTPVAERMLRVGERSGNMGEMMERIAAFYDEELSRFVDVATRLIEPAMMTVIGLVIGLIVVLMYFPIFELAGSIR